MKDLKTIKGKFYLQRIIAEGEHETQDFKCAISDARKIARSLSAFANHSGGQLLVGVKDNGVIAGVRNEEDIYVIEQAARLYCRPAQELSFTAIAAGEGAVVIRAEIASSPVRPVQACDTDGRWKTFYRVADENILATPLMVKAWRRAASDEPVAFTLGEAENAVLSHLREQGHSTIEQIMTAARLSRIAAEEIIIRLYTMEIIHFPFINRQFQIAPL